MLHCLLRLIVGWEALIYGEIIETHIIGGSRRLLWWTLIWNLGRLLLLKRLLNLRKRGWLFGKNVLLLSLHLLRLSLLLRLLQLGSLLSILCLTSQRTKEIFSFTQVIWLIEDIILRRNLTLIDWSTSRLRWLLLPCILRICLSLSLRRGLLFSQLCRCWSTGKLVTRIRLSLIWLLASTTKVLRVKCWIINYCGVSLRWFLLFIEYSSNRRWVISFYFHKTLL